MNKVLSEDYKKITMYPTCDTTSDVNDNKNMFFLVNILLR